MVVGLVAGIMFVGMAGSWWYLSARASQVSDLEVRLEAMGREQVRLEAVAADLAFAEAQYARLRSLLVPSLPPGDGGIWLPLAGGSASDGESGGMGVSGVGGAPPGLGYSCANRFVYSGCRWREGC